MMSPLSSLTDIQPIALVSEGNFGNLIDGGSHHGSKKKSTELTEEGFARSAAALDALSPLKVLGRGYGIPRRTDGGVIRSVKEVDTGDGLELRLSDGSLTCTVLDKRTDRRSKSRA